MSQDKIPYKLGDESKKPENKIESFNVEGMLPGLESIREASKAKRCEVSKETLKSGIRIPDARTLESIKIFLSKNHIFDLSKFQFESTNYNAVTSLVLKLTDDQKTIHIYLDKGNGNFLKKIGSIKSGGEYQKSIDVFSSLNSENFINKTSVSDVTNLECTVEKVKTPQINDSSWVLRGNEESEKNNVYEAKSEKKEKLENGVNIENETHYNQVKHFIESNYNIKMCDYGDIDINQAGIKHNVTNVAFILKVDNINKQVVLYPPIVVNWSSRFGFIKGGKFEANMSWYPDRVNSAESIKFPEEKSTEYVSLKQINLNDVKKDQKTTPIYEQKKVAKMQTSGDNIINQNEEKKPISKNIEYTVQKGDKLWDIIQKYYNITDKRDTANIINKVVDFNMKHNPPSTDLEKQIIQDGIKGDKIHIGQKIILPGNIVWRTKTFTLIQNNK